MTENEKEYIHALAKYIRSLDLETGHYEYSVIILQTGKDKDLSFFKEYLVPVTEKYIWNNEPHETEVNNKCHNSIIKKKRHLT